MIETLKNVKGAITKSSCLTQLQKTFLLTTLSKEHLEENAPHIFVLESTGSFDQITSTKTYPFVHISSFSQLKKYYDGCIYIRPSKEALSFDWESYLGMSYERDFKELLKSTHNKNYKSSHASMFCSEMVAFILNQMGIYKDNPSNCTPAELQSAVSKIERFEDFEIYWKTEILFYFIKNGSEDLITGARFLYAATIKGRSDKILRPTTKYKLLQVGPEAVVSGDRFKNDRKAER